MSNITTLDRIVGYFEGGSLGCLKSTYKKIGGFYEQFVGCPPFFNGQADTQKLITMITTKSVFFPTKEKHNIDMSDDARDFIS